MDEHDNAHLSQLAQEFTADELRDHRRKYKLPEGMVVGSIEYMKWMVEQQALRQRLYQKRAYLKRRKLTLALQKNEEFNATTIEIALAQVDEDLAEMRALRPVSYEPVRRGRPAKDGSLKMEEVVEEVPFIRDMATRHNVSYEEAKGIMTGPDYKGDESFEEAMNSRLLDIISAPKKDGE